MAFRALIPAALLALALAGCGDPAVRDANAPNPAEAPPPPVEERPEADVEKALAGIDAEVSGMDLYMHDIAPTGDTRRKPTLWVHAAKATKSADNSWALSDAQAVIYREQEGDIQLASAAGRFDEANKVAVLEGGVQVSAGTVTLETESVSYDNAVRTVETMAPVELSDGATVLSAEKATLEPEDGAVTLTNVTGMLSLSGNLAR